MMQYDAFKKATAQRFMDKYNELKEVVNCWIQDEANEKKVSASFNFTRWNELGKYIWPWAPGWADRTTYQAEVDYLIEWTNNRLDWLYTEFSGWLN